MRKLFSFGFLLIGIYLHSFADDQNQIQQLKLQLQSASTDSTKAQTLLDLSREFAQVNADSCIKYASLAESMARTNKLHFIHASSLLNSAKSYLDLSNYEKAISNGFEALRLFEQLRLKKDIAAAYAHLGMSFFYTQNYEKAIENWTLAQKNYKALNDSTHLSNISLNIGGAYASLEDNSTSLRHFQQALLYSGNKNETTNADIYNNMGTILYNEYVSSNDQTHLYKALPYFKSAKDIFERQQDSLHFAYALLNIGSINIELGNLRQSESQLFQSLKVFQSLDQKLNISSAYSLLADLYYKQEKFKLAYSYRDSSYQIESSFRSEASDKAIIEMDTKYKSEKKQKENELLLIDNELHKAISQERKLLNYGMGAGIFALLAVTILIFLQFRTKQKANKLLDLQNKTILSRNDEISNQRDQIEFQNNELVSSINYAKRIQEAILPVERTIKDTFQDCFTLYKPKDIVSGDFYWVEEIEEKVFWAVADCTGHGVPGAFLSILGSTGLKKIVTEHHIHTPSQILDQLTSHVVNSLKESKDGIDLSDGMDIALCCWDRSTDTLEYAGAYNPLYLVRNNEVLITKGTRRPIGSYGGKIKSNFENHSLKILKDDRIYIFSDGFIDQFGSKNETKFSSEQFRDLIFKIHQFPMEKQKELLNTAFYNWKGDEEQIDDICVFGVHI